MPRMVRRTRTSLKYEGIPCQPTRAKRQEAYLNSGKTRQMDDHDKTSVENGGANDIIVNMIARARRHLCHCGILPNCPERADPAYEARHPGGMLLEQGSLADSEGAHSAGEAQAVSQA